MGIDFYLYWDHMTEEEKKAHFTGFVTTGGAGYIREAYHGGPYATEAYCPESWETQRVLLHGDFIPPEPDDYESKEFEDVPEEIGNLDIRELRARLPAVKEACIERGRNVYPSEPEYPLKHYQAFVEFTELAERKVAEGKRVFIHNSY